MVSELKQIVTGIIVIIITIEFLGGISRTLLCSMADPQVEIVPLLDTLRLLMSFSGR
jgi:hypothetical protein